jgi:hypothetical protein
MRERTTWNRTEILSRTAATNRQADPYTMNQTHTQPAADAYVTGDPSSFAEDVAPNTWAPEYSGGQVRRNEIGMPEMRPETFTHKEKTAGLDEALLIKKADLCVSLARQMLANRKFANAVAAEAAVEEQSIALMDLPDANLIETFSRLAGDQAEQEPEQQAQQEAKQANEAALLPLAQQAAQQVASGDQAGAQATITAMVRKACEMQQPIAQQQAPVAQQQAPAQQAPVAQQQQAPVAQQQPSVEQQVQAMIQSAMKQANQAPVAQQAPPMQQQGQQQQTQAQMDQQAQQQAQLAAQQQEMLAQQQMQQQAQQQQAPAQQQVQASDDMLLDQMLGGPPAMGGVSEMDIQLDAAPMDVGEVTLAPEDDVLRTLFANQETQDAEEAQQLQGGDQQKQASIRTAATRTVGTRPAGGVARIGGGVGGGPAPKAGEIDRLQSMWQSAPDVRDAFGLK